MKDEGFSTFGLECGVGSLDDGKSFRVINEDGIESKWKEEIVVGGAEE